MARELNLTTQKQEFLKECYLKELITRVNWRHCYGHNLQRFTNTKDNISMPKMKDYFKLPAIPEAAFNGSKKRSETIHENTQIPKDKNKTDGADGGELTLFTDPLMRPPSPNTLSLLYCKREQGRYHYMKVRNKLKPENKYSYPFISSWDYGWQLGNASDSDSSRYRRCCIVKDTFFRKNGLLTEPHHTDKAL